MVYRKIGVFKLFLFLLNILRIVQIVQICRFQNPWLAKWISKKDCNENFLRRWQCLNLGKMSYFLFGYIEAFFDQNKCLRWLDSIFWLQLFPLILDRSSTLHHLSSNDRYSDSTQLTLSLSWPALAKPINPWVGKVIELQ